MPTYLKTGGRWVKLAGTVSTSGGGGGGGGGTVIDRSTLRPMIDKPTAATTGLDGSIAFADMIDVVGSGTVPAHTTSTTTPQVGKIFWGIEKWNTTATYRNCIFAGPAPDTWPESTPGNPSYGCTQNYGTGPVMAEMYDCLYDPSLWLTARAPGGAQPKLNRYNIGHHGGNVRLYRCEIKNVSDGINFIGPNGSAAAANAGEFLMQQCFLHKALYGNNLYPPNDGQPHCDGFQTNYGKNITLRGNVIGGARDKTGYLIWPGGYNSGDDFWNTAIILKQEAAPDRGTAGTAEEIGAIENVLIEGNWLTGGNATVNQTTVGAYPSSWQNVVIRNNRFGRRLPGWEQKMAPSKDASGNYIPYSTAVRNDSPAAPNYGYYIIRPSVYSSFYSGNVMEDDGSAVPFTNGS